MLKSMLGQDANVAAIAEYLQKAAVTAATYTFSPDSRSIFVAENLDPIVKLIIPTATPVRSLMPRKQGRGQAAAWKKLTSALDPSAPGTGTSGFFADGGTPGQTTQTYSVVSAAYKLLGRKLDVGLQHIKSSEGYMNVEDEQLRIKTLEVMLAEEDAILNGDSTVDTNQFDGLIKQITTNSGTAVLLTASGISGTYARTIFNLGGNPSHLICSARQGGALADELQRANAIQRIVISDAGAAVANLRVSQIIDSSSGNPIDIVISRYVGAWALLLSLKSPAGENYIEMEDLIPLIKLDVPSTTFSKTSFLVESTVLKVMGEPFQYKIGGLATS